MQQWLENECDDWITKDQWSAKSPDLNPLDYGIWGILTKKVASMRKELRNIDDLKQLLTWQGKEISLETLRKTCGSWGKRL